LLPLQELAVKRHGLFGGQNLLVQAPTSSGKTFIGEMAAIQAALRRKKVVYLVPLKALAEEKYRNFTEKYTPYGLRVIISTRDRREFDAALENGDFSIAVVVYEKLSQLLVRRPERIEEIALVVADELEILSDPERGAMAEVLLTRVLQSSARVLGLSAVIGEAEKLAAWMEADLLAFERRPVELRYGVLHEGVFRYRTYNDYGEGEEVLAESEGDSPWETLMETVRSFVAQGEACLVFVKAKHESRRGAELLAARLDHPVAAQTLEALERLEPTRSREGLRETLASAVAFHNADLSIEARRLVEQGFRTGEIRVVVSTSTLAMGMNLPARNVFIAPEKWRYDRRFGMPWKTPILHAEYENMGGRAGRYGAGYAFGRAILIASTPFDRETLWRRYIEGDHDRIEPQLTGEPLEKTVLQLVASRIGQTEQELQAFLDRTLSGQWVWRDTLTVEECTFRVRAAIHRAVEAGGIAERPGERLEPTPFGLAVAAKGVSLATARDLEHWIGQSERRDWHPVDLLLAAAMTPDGRSVQVALTAREYDQADYPGRLKQLFRPSADGALTQGEDIGADVPLNRFRNCTVMPFFEEVRAIKTALFLNEWIDHASVRDLEETYHTMAGQIRAAADQVSWLVDATAAIATVLGKQPDLVEQIKTVSRRVQRGLHAELLPLAQGGGRRLSRNALLTLAAHGLTTPETLADVPAATLAAWVAPSEAQRLKAWAAQTLAAAQSDAPQQAAARPAPVLVVDDRRPNEIHLEGQSIRLQDKQYRLVRVLAGAPGECVPYDTIYTAVWGDSIVEPNQMHFQKRRLLAAVTAHLPHHAQLITTVPKRGFVLNLEPDQIVRTAAAVVGAA